MVVNLLSFLLSTHSFDIVMFVSLFFVCDSSIFVSGFNQQEGCTIFEITLSVAAVNSVFQCAISCFKIMVKSLSIGQMKKKTNQKKKKIVPTLCRNSWSFFGGCSSILVFCMFHVFLKSHRLLRDIFYTYLLYS